MKKGIGASLGIGIGKVLILDSLEIVIDENNISAEEINNEIILRNIKRQQWEWTEKISLLEQLMLVEINKYIEFLVKPNLYISKYPTLLRILDMYKLKSSLESL